MELLFSLFCIIAYFWFLFLHYKMEGWEVIFLKHCQLACSSSQLYFHRKTHKDIRKILRLWFNDQAVNIMKGVFRIFPKIDKPFCKCNGFHTWKCVEKVHINIVDLSYAKGFRIPYNHIHLGFLWPCAFDFFLKK